MKKIINILLAFLIFINSGGFVIIFYQMRSLINQEMFQYIKCHKYLFDELISFRIPKKDLFNNRNGFIWEKKKEFFKDNKLFDIVEISEDKNDNNYVFVYALNDKREETMVKTFTKNINKLVNDKTKSPKLRTILSNLISQALPIINIKLFFEQTKQNGLTYSSQIPLFFYKTPISPPPEIS